MKAHASRAALERARYWISVAECCLDPLPPEKPSRLVHNWRWVLLKSHSMRFSAIAAAGLWWALSNLDVVIVLIGQAPPEVRAFIPLWVSVGGFVLVAGLRLWKQHKK